MKKNLNIEAVKLYIEREGQECLFCGESNPEGMPFDVRDGAARQEMYCHACGEEWVDSYHLKAVIYKGEIFEPTDEGKSLPNIKGLLTMLGDYETYLQDSSNRMETYERREYTNADRKAMQEKIAAVQAMQQEIAAQGGAE